MRRTEKLRMAIDISDIPPQVYITLVSGIGIGAGMLQRRILSGDQGLGAFLDDGKGFKKSAYRARSKSKGSKATKDQNVPNPGWLAGLKLPNLDFVEVYGEDEADVTEGLMTQEEVTDEDRQEVIMEATQATTAEPIDGTLVRDDMQEVKRRASALEEAFDEAVFKQDFVTADAISKEMDELKRAS